MAEPETHRVPTDLCRRPDPASDSPASADTTSTESAPPVTAATDEDEMNEDVPVDHNHLTRDIRPRGQCPACDRYHDTQDSPG